MDRHDFLGAVAMKDELTMRFVEVSSASQIGGPRRERYRLMDTSAADE
jgi:hypothetical protein